MNDIPFFCRACKAVKPHTFGETKAECACGHVTAVRRGLMVPGPRPLLRVEPVRPCPYCRQTVSEGHACVDGGDLFGGPGDLERVWR